jgi:asparagine synthase (glutamine-hydrolysing)
MSAFCVLWARDGGDVTRGLALMHAALADYGSDWRSTWVAGSIGFGVNQFHTLPEDGLGSQPGPASADGVVVVSNLRLDNREELRKAFELTEAAAAALPDRDFLRLAWRKWGTECVRHLVGDFAFAIWSERDRLLFCARDPLGGRPLCFAHLHNAVAVASVPAGILALPDCPTDINEDRIARFVVGAPPDRAQTFFRAISMLRPGHVLRITPERIETEPYWQFARRTIRYRRDEDYVEHFREIFAEAVRCRLRAVGPVASTLSAGLDSGAVAAVAARELSRVGRPLLALTWRPAGTFPVVHHMIADEWAGASEVAGRYPNIEHVAVTAGDGCLLRPMSALHQGMNRPVGGPLALPLVWAMAEQIRSRGGRVLLTGSAGNFSMSYHGLDRLPAMLRAGRLAPLAREIWAHRVRPGGIREALKRSLSLRLPGTIRRTLLSLGRQRRPEFAPPLINAAFARAHGLASARHHQPAWSTDGWVMRTASLLGYDDLGSRTTGTLAALGFEDRDPSRDIRVVEFCLAVPDDQFLRHGQRRWLIRRAMRGLLPEATLDETRRGLQVADWPRVIAPHLQTFSACIDELERNPLASAALDLPALRRMVAAWPQTPEARDQLLCRVFLRAFDVGTFILRFSSAAQRG